MIEKKFYVVPLSVNHNILIHETCGVQPLDNLKIGYQMFFNYKFKHISISSVRISDTMLYIAFIPTVRCIIRNSIMSGTSQINNLLKLSDGFLS